MGGDGSDDSEPVEENSRRFGGDDPQLENRDSICPDFPGRSYDRSTEKEMKETPQLRGSFLWYRKNRFSYTIKKQR